MNDGAMRVGIAVPAFLHAPDFGGPVGTVALLAEALAARGHAVTILTADYGPNRSRVAPQVVTGRGYAAHYLKTVARYRWAPVLAPGALAKVPWEFDVVHVCGLRDGVGAAVVRRAAKQGTPYVIEPMGMAPARLRNALLKTVFDRLLTERHLRGAASVVATSEKERDALEAHYGLRTVVVRPNPLAPSAQAVAPKEPGGTAPLEVLFVGRVCRTKNLPALLEAVEPYDDVRVTIAGPDDRDGTREALAPIAARMGERVALRGWVDADERDRLIAASDICVLPSITENFGNFAVEAAARLRPVVVTSACGVAAFLGDAAVVVEPTVAGLRAGIARLAGDASLRHALARAGARRAAELGPAAIAEAQEHIYRQALRSVDHDNPRRS